MRACKTPAVLELHTSRIQRQKNLSLDHQSSSACIYNKNLHWQVHAMDKIYGFDCVWTGAQHEFHSFAKKLRFMFLRDLKESSDKRMTSRSCIFEFLISIFFWSGAYDYTSVFSGHYWQFVIPFFAFLLFIYVYVLLNAFRSS